MLNEDCSWFLIHSWSQLLLTRKVLWSIEWIIKSVISLDQSQYLICSSPNHEDLSLQKCSSKQTPNWIWRKQKMNFRGLLLLFTCNRRRIKKEIHLFWWIEELLMMVFFLCFLIICRYWRRFFIGWSQMLWREGNSDWREGGEEGYEEWCENDYKEWCKNHKKRPSQTHDQHPHALFFFFWESRLFLPFWILRVGCSSSIHNHHKIAVISWSFRRWTWSSWSTSFQTSRNQTNMDRRRDSFREDQQSSFKKKTKNGRFFWL